MDFQGVVRGNSVFGAAFAEAVDVEINPVAVVDAVDARRHGHEAFPAIGHHLRGVHFKGLAIDDHGRLDGLPTDVLLLRGKCHFDRIKIVLITGLLPGREIGDLRRAAGEQRYQQKR